MRIKLENAKHVLVECRRFKRNKTLNGKKDQWRNFTTWNNREQSEEAWVG